jgi:hypothetical protein
VEMRHSRFARPVMPCVKTAIYCLNPQHPTLRLSERCRW